MQIGLDLMWTGVIGGGAGLRRPSPARGDAHERRSAELWPYLVLILVGFLPNEVWRAARPGGWRAASTRIPQIVVWSRAVATAMLAGVIAKLIVFATGALATIPFACGSARRLGGFVAFLAGPALGVRRRAGRRGAAARSAGSSALR